MKFKWRESRDPGISSSEEDHVAEVEEREREESGSDRMHRRSGASIAITDFSAFPARPSCLSSYDRKCPDRGFGCKRSETHPDPDAVPKEPIEKGWSAAEVVDIADLSDAGGDSDDAMAFKRGPRRGASCKNLKQITELTRIVESRSDTGYFLQRDDAVIISSISLPNLSSTSKKLPAAPPPTPVSSSVSPSLLHIHFRTNH